MKSSGNSSAPSHATWSPSAPSRRRFALTGPSRPFDPRTTAARADLADVRVADRVFAPHYAAPLTRDVVASATVTTDKDGEPATTVQPGEQFEVLELTATHAWGVASDGTVGYLPLSALAQA